jgi:hypothetical protein
MVRMCHVKMFAMATICMAGSAMAADRAALAASTNAKSTAFQSWMEQSPRGSDIATVVGNPADNGLQFAVANCLCRGWDNGDFSNDQNSDGIASHEGGAFANGIQAADDFYLCEGNIYKLNSISATVFTNSQPGIFTKARLEIYADCDGHPACGAPLYVLKDFTTDDVGTPWMMNPAYRVVTYHFAIGPNNLDPINRSIYLHGGVYWISLVGISDGVKCAMGVMPDATYWGSTNGGVKGSVPQYRSGSPKNVCDVNKTYTCNWAPVDCCFGCRDLAFVVCADECKILVDNGTAAGIRAGFGTPAGSPSQWAPQDSSNDERSADDFVVPPCNTFSICYIEGCVFTNCDPTKFIGHYEIYGNTCRYPSYTCGGTTLCAGTATKVVDLIFALTINGKPYEAYRLEFHNVNCTLQPGQYWLSISVEDNYNGLFRSFFCYNYDCNRACLIRWNPAMFLPPMCPLPPGAKTPWLSVGHDLSFLIAGTLTHVNASNSTGACAADFNGDGSATVQDLFDFLSAWFAGCH